MYKLVSMVRIGMENVVFTKNLSLCPGIVATASLILLHVHSVVKIPLHFRVMVCLISVHILWQLAVYKWMNCIIYIYIYSSPHWHNLNFFNNILCSIDTVEFLLFFIRRPVSLFLFIFILECVPIFLHIFSFLHVLSLATFCSWCSFFATCNFIS